jgi:hypothetical protein
VQKIVNSLSEKQSGLIRETEKTQMVDLDEDDLIALHSRIRRARNKYVTSYRRAGAAKVSKKGARGSAKAANSRKADKAEAFEDALSRVSRRLADVSRHSASALKEQRLALARTDSSSPSAPVSGQGKVRSTGRPKVDTTRESPGRKKREASTTAAGARRQAKKDQR